MRSQTSGEKGVGGASGGGQEDGRWDVGGERQWAEGGRQAVIWIRQCTNQMNYSHHSPTR